MCGTKKKMISRDPDREHEDKPLSGPQGSGARRPLEMHSERVREGGKKGREEELKTSPQDSIYSLRREVGKTHATIRRLQREKDIWGE